jgi:hypothetical protein
VNDLNQFVVAVVIVGLRRLPERKEDGVVSVSTAAAATTTRIMMARRKRTTTRVSTALFLRKGK